MQFHWIICKVCLSTVSARENFSKKDFRTFSTTRDVNIINDLILSHFQETLLSNFDFLTKMFIFVSTKRCCAHEEKHFTREKQIVRTYLLNMNFVKIDWNEWSRSMKRKIAFVWFYRVEWPRRTNRPLELHTMDIDIDFHCSNEPIRLLVLLTVYVCYQGKTFQLLNISMYYMYVDFKYNTTVNLRFKQYSYLNGKIRHGFRSDGTDRGATSHWKIAPYKIQKQKKNREGN